MDAVQIILFIVIGIGGGVLGGMGMGGGTLLIPLLTLFTGTDQHVAQAVNLIAFIPMSLVALIIHIKNKLVKFEYLLFISLPAVAASIFSSWLARGVEGKSLSLYFGIFLILLGVYQLITIIITAKRDYDKKKLLEGEIRL